MKVAIFSSKELEGGTLFIEDEINQWLEAEKLGPEDILCREQSQSSGGEGCTLIISVWYIPQPVEPEREFVQCDNTENLPGIWEENCPQWKAGKAFCGYHRDWHDPDGECPTSAEQAKYFNTMNKGFDSDEPPF